MSNCEPVLAQHPIGNTALAHGLTLATRNTRHFTDIVGLALEN